MRAIQSRDNPLYKAIRRLRDTARERRDAGLTLLDGLHLIEAACDAGVMPRDVLVSDRVRARSEVASLLCRVPDAAVVVLPDALFDGLSPVDSPTGILATLPIPGAGTAPDPRADWLVLDGVQDAGNLGTLLRTAVAAGIRHILLGAGCAHVWGPKALRAGMGAHFACILHEIPDLPATLAEFRGHVAVTRLDGAQSLYTLDLRGPIAWVFGAEGQGVSPAVANCAGLGVAVPMASGIESLNVAAAAAVCLFEQRRQRLAASGGGCQPD